MVARVALTYSEGIAFSRFDGFRACVFCYSARGARARAFTLMEFAGQRSFSGYFAGSLQVRRFLFCLKGLGLRCRDTPWDGFDWRDDILGWFVGILDNFSLMRYCN